MSYHRFATAMVGETEQFAVRVSCRKQGCVKPHGDDGRILLCDDAAEAASFARDGLGGHAYDLVTRVVNYPEWEDVT